jgi:adenylate cyclase
VLGDTVNVASRLEARTKDYRIPIGARNSVSQDPNFQELRDLTARMLGYYRGKIGRRCWQQSNFARKVAEGFSIGALHDIYAERIEAFGLDPPPPDWNGVYKAESK